MPDFFSTETAAFLTDMKIPNTYWDKKSEVYKYWFRSLLHKIDSSIIFKNLPKGFSNDFFMFCLWVRGYLLIFKPDPKDILKNKDQYINLNDYGENGVVFNPCFISGYDLYYQPLKATVANPYLSYSHTYDLRGEKGKNAALLKLTPDFLGILDILDFYASKLACLSEAIDMSIMNSKMGVIATATGEAQAATLKAVYDKLMSGQSLIVFDDMTKDADEVMPKKDPFNIWIQELKKNYILTDQLQDFQTILNSFYCEIGLPVAIEKKERLVTSEADFASAQSQARIACWIQTLEESLEVINEKFNLNIGVEYARENDDNSGGVGTEQKNDSAIAENSVGPADR